MERVDQLSIRPRVLLLLLVLATLAGAIAFETIRAGRPQSGSTAPPTGSSVIPPGSEAPFEITGSVSGLAPGLTKEIAVTLANPNAVPIHVVALVVAIAEERAPPGCSSGDNIELRQATGITEQDPVRVPAGGSVTLIAYPRTPTLTLRNLDVDQDDCKNVSFELTFTGKARA